LIKGSKDLDTSLVSNENFSETLWPSSWALRQVTWAKNDPKTTSLMHSQKIRNTQPKYFWVQTRRLSDLFQPMNSSLAQSAEELWC